LTQAAKTYIAPRTPTEEQLARIWSEILRLDRIGVEDNFFTLGGHSLLVTQAIARMSATFKVHIPLRRIFELPTVAMCAAEIDKQMQATGINETQSQPEPVIKRVARKTAVLPLTPD
jgi:acyl carrier protein